MSDGGVCGMCLDPFALERCPKRLPCSHAFCLPCLEELVQHAATKSQMSTESTCCAEEMRSQALEAEQPVTFPCPTCRVNTIVPAGGVTQFPSNLLQLDKEHKLSSNTLPCDLCDGSQDAVYSCSDCHNNFCSLCDKIHRKLTSDHHVQSLLTKVQTREEYDLDNKMKEKAEKQAMIVEKALAQLWEEESKIEEELKLMADKISKRYSTLMMYINEAKAKSEQDLEMVTETTRNKLQNYKSKARRILSDLWHVIHSYDNRKSGHGSIATLQATLKNDDELQFYKQLAFCRSKTFNWFVHKADDNCITPDSVQAYIGSVISVDLTTDISTDTSPRSIVEVENGHVPVEDSSKGSRQELVHVGCERSDPESKAILEDLVLKCDVLLNKCTVQPVDVTAKNLQDLIALHSEKLCQELRSFKDIFTNEIMRKSLHEREFGDVRTLQINDDFLTEVLRGHLILNAYCLEQNYTIWAPESIFLFNKVATNIGDGYNPETGIFTATTSGKYVFIFSVVYACANFYGRQVFNICVDNRDIAIVHPTIRSQSVEGGICRARTHARVQLNAGQKVWIKIIGQTEKLFLDSHGMLTYFTSVLLCDYDCGNIDKHFPM